MGIRTGNSRVAKKQIQEERVESRDIRAAHSSCTVRTHPMIHQRRHEKLSWDFLIRKKTILLVSPKKGYTYWNEEEESNMGASET